MKDYPIHVFYSEEDGCYVANIPDLRFCSAFGDTPEEAVREVEIAKVAWLETAKQQGRNRMSDDLTKKVSPASRVKPITVEIAPGELIDKITILEIKSERIADAEKLRNVRVELETLVAARDQALTKSEALTRLTADLKAVNEALWQIEDEIRGCERSNDFGPRFIELARSVYRQNDRRAAVKRQINELLGSKLIEEKSYTAYA